MHDALCVLSQTVNDSRVLLGGGWPEMVMAKEIDALARKTPGKKSLAMEAFSRALLAIPTTIADNAGLDSAELISQLRAEHQNEGCTAGIDVISGSVSTIQIIAWVYWSVHNFETLHLNVAFHNLFLGRSSVSDHCIHSGHIILTSAYNMKCLIEICNISLYFVSCSHF